MTCNLFEMILEKQIFWWCSYVPTSWNDFGNAKSATLLTHFIKSYLSKFNLNQWSLQGHHCCVILYSNISISSWISFGKQSAKRNTSSMLVEIHFGQVICYYDCIENFEAVWIIVLWSFHANWDNPWVISSMPLQSMPTSCRYRLT